MKVVSSYAIEIKNIQKIFRQTIKIYNDAITFCVRCLENEWDSLQYLDKFGRYSLADSYIHNTRNNSAKYDFDTKFPKMPTYLRMSVINTALGVLSSYHTNLEIWESNPSSGNPPRLQSKVHKLPTFYRGNMFKDDCEGDYCRLKLFVNNDWNWVKVKLKHTDIMYIARHCQNAKMSCPTLERRNKKYYLRFAFEETVSLDCTSLTEQRILAVDMGINTDAVCSVMNIDGAILGRKFINFPSDKDHLHHTLNKIKGIQQKYNNHNTDRLWREATHTNTELSRKIAKSIVDYAVNQGVSVIVLEHLDFRGKIRGSKKQKLALWRKKYIQQLVEHKAHKSGIRISTVNPCNTSKLAFDGSGVAVRGEDAGFNNNKLCRFSNGKTYNCDLSASYNIGARYFIREFRKSISEMRWSDIVAKVPECQSGLQYTYSTLIKINQVV